MGVACAQLCAVAHSKGAVHADLPIVREELPHACLALSNIVLLTAEVECLHHLLLRRSDFLIGGGVVGEDGQGLTLSENDSLGHVWVSD